MAKLSEDDINLLQSFFVFLTYNNGRFHWYFINIEVFNKYRIEYGLPPVVDNKKNVTFNEKSSLNKRSELISTCRHSRKFLFTQSCV